MENVEAMGEKEMQEGKGGSKKGKRLKATLKRR